MEEEYYRKKILQFGSICLSLRCGFVFAAEPFKGLECSVTAAKHVSRLLLLK